MTWNKQPGPVCACLPRRSRRRQVPRTGRQEVWNSASNGLGRSYLRSLFYPVLDEPYGGAPGTIKEGLGRINSELSFIASSKRFFSPGCLTFLDIGERTVCTDYLEQQLGVSILNTEGDLDRDAKYPSHPVDRVFFLQTIEHLTNPLHCLDSIHATLSDDGLVVLSTPLRFQMNWGVRHFHEFSPDRLAYLLRKAGFEILDWARLDQKDMFGFGIRPVLRRLCSWFLYGWPEGSYIFLLGKVDENVMG